MYSQVLNVAQQRRHVVVEVVHQSRAHFGDQLDTLPAHQLFHEGLVIGEHEERSRADLKAVAKLQHVHLDRLAVDQRAIATTQVFEHVVAGFGLEDPRMAARDVVARHVHGHVGIAPDHQLVGEHVASAG
jgi:hypothetical protein